MTLDNAKQLRKIKEAAQSPAESCASMPVWFSLHRKFTAGIEHSLARALVAGAHFRQVSFAFASAYQSALENMFGLDGEQTAALCHNEKNAKKPREMQSRIYQANGTLRLDSRKGFVSGGTDAQILFVSALDDRPSANQSVVLLKLDNTDNRLALEALPALPFVSELGHAKFMCDGLSVSDAAVMDGDGYSDYVKPFRTEEDLHILAALCGQRASIAIALDQKRLAEQLFAIGRSIVGMQEETRSAASTHLLLAGVKQQLLSVFDQQDDLLKEAMPDYAKLWQRDKALLSLAQGAQAKRTQLAWDHFLALD